MFLVDSELGCLVVCLLSIYRYRWKTTHCYGDRTGAITTAATPRSLKLTFKALEALELERPDAFFLPDASTRLNSCNQEARI